MQKPARLIEGREDASVIKDESLPEFRLRGGESRAELRSAR